MKEPSFRTAAELHLIGTMSIYSSQEAASEGIPRQWRAFRSEHPTIEGGFYGASPCTNDHELHYLTGIAEGSNELAGERLTLAAGEYAVVRVDDPKQLRDTWVWLLGTWLPASGRKERHAPELERFTGVSETGAPVGPVEIWIPLEPL